MNKPEYNRVYLVEEFDERYDGSRICGVCKSEYFANRLIDYYAESASLYHNVEYGYGSGLDRTYLVDGVKIRYTATPVANITKI